ncbi:hypothetical protein BS17DRAFT_770610 [Gyrodon lividus]|nr:hypothetical protein BS17DRAFT_770610 [Gyrodon lividus]
MYDLQRRLLHTEENFLNALASDNASLATYETDWCVLQSEVSRAIQAGDADEHTLAIAHTVASHIATIAECYLDLQIKARRWTTDLHHDWESILRGMGNLQLPPVASQSLDVLASSTSATSHLLVPVDVKDIGPSYIAPAYQWLLANLHNPYPSTEVKQSIATETGYHICSISSWFVNVRRRMGWTTLCRDYFQGCRADTVDAACRVLVQENENRALAPELIHAFMVMKVTAEGLYSSTFSKSILAGDLDAMVKDMTKEDKTLVENEKRLQAEEAKLMKEHAKELRRNQRALGGEGRKKSSLQDSYPSPDRSHSSSPAPTLDESLTDDNEGGDVLPSVVAGRKRRSSSVAPIDPISFMTAMRPTKRSRSTVSLTSSFATEICLPSPPLSVGSIADSLDDGSITFAAQTPSPEPPIQTHISTALSRKRRLSDADASGVSKRPRGPMAAPRLHAVSDPLPRPHVESEYSIDEWFSTNSDALFALPPPADAVEPDFSAQWEIELFRDYNLPQDLQKRTSKLLSPPSQHSQTSAPTNLAVLESLLQSIDNGGFVALSETVNSTSPFVTSPADLVSCDISSSSYLSQSIDWTRFLNDTETLEPTIDSIFPQQSFTDSQPLPEIDLAISQLPQVTPIVTSQTTSSGDLASKQTKLNQLRAMQEAVRQMQKELQSEGVAL